MGIMGYKDAVRITSQGESKDLTKIVRGDSIRIFNQFGIWIVEDSSNAHGLYFIRSMRITPTDKTVIKKDYHATDEMLRLGLLDEIGEDFAGRASLEQERFYDRHLAGKRAVEVVA